MMYVSRFSNPELRTGEYTALRISIGTPKWPLGYVVAGAINDLMPYGLLNKYTHDEFVIRYRQRLDRIGSDRIWTALEPYMHLGKPVVLLCYEDVRVEGQTCHRTTFAEWWTEQTGEIVRELPDPSTPRGAASKSRLKVDSPQTLHQMAEAMKKASERIESKSEGEEQLKMF